MDAPTTGTIEPLPGENGRPPSSDSAPAMPAEWSPTYWGTYPQAALQFASDEGLNALIDEFWSDPLLRGMPRFYVGDNTVIVPASVVEGLRRKGHQFVVQKVVSAGDLPAEEVNRIRRSEEPC